MLKPATDVLPPQLGVKRYFLVPKHCFAAIGIDPTSEELIIVNRFLTWVPMLSLLTLCFPMSIYATQHLDDMNLVTDALSPVWQSVLAIIKFFIFMWNKEKIVRLVRKMWGRNLEARNEELRIIAEENNHEARFSVLYYSTVIFTGTFALLAPFGIAGFYKWKGYDFLEALEPPLKGVYIMDTKASYLGYAFSFVWNVLGIYYVMHGTVSIDTLFSWFMYNISAQFRILNLRLKSTADDVAKDTKDDTSSDDAFRQALVQCIDYHRSVIDLVHMFNDVYKVTVFVKFLISCLQIAFLAFQFAQGGELVAQLFHLSFLMCVSIQLMLYCYCGQRLKDESSSVAVAIYKHFQWHALSVKAKKLLLLPLIRAQKPCHLTGGVFVADLDLFLWVFKTAASFIAMMMSIQQKESV